MRNRSWLKWALIAGGVVLVLVVVAPFVYFNFIKEDAPEKLSASDVTVQDGTNVAIDGTYSAGDGSEAGYRAKEVLFGQDATAAGRTDQIDGAVTIAGTTVSNASFTVDMASVASDEDRRDNQFRGRIMDVESFPTATFELTEPIELNSIPDIGKEITAQAIGEFTLRGTTKSVTFDVTAKRTSEDAIAVSAQIPITWSEWGIPEPSFGPASVADNGEIEFLLVLNRA